MGNPAEEDDKLTDESTNKLIFNDESIKEHFRNTACFNRKAD